MFVLHRTLIWLKRFRYRRGYGVHSPFAFDFITGVVYEHGIYYAYSGLDALYGLQVNRIGCFVHLRKAYRRRCARLLFRISNYVHPDYILVLGRAERWIDGYLKNGCISANVVKCNTPEEVIDSCFFGKTLLVYTVDVPLAVRALSALRGISAQSSVFLVDGIHAQKTATHEWHRFQQHPLVGITFDLYDLGVAFLDRERCKQHYLVNF